MDETKKEVGKRLAEIRKSKNLNQKQFMDLIGAPTVQMISGWENGHSFPSPNYLVIIAKKLDISLDYLLLGKQNGSEDKNIRSYKDAVIHMLALLNCGLFYLNGFEFGKNQYKVYLESCDLKIADFKNDYEDIKKAAKLLRPELYEQAIIDLINKYDFPLKK